MKNIKLVETRLVDCYRIIPFISEDERGSFIKLFKFDLFENYCLETNYT